MTGSGIRAESHHFPANRYADDEKDQAHHQEQEKEELRNSRGRRSDSGKSEQRRHQRDYQKNYSPA
jgi:hypothetical protein